MPDETMAGRGYRDGGAIDALKSARDNTGSLMQDMERVHKELEMLRDTVSTLRSRLSPLLAGEQPIPGSADVLQKDSREPSQARQSAQALRRVVSDIRGELEYLTSLIDL